MEFTGETKILRIFISSTDRLKHTLLSEAIVLAAKRYGLEGASVIKGTMGYGGSNSIASTKIWDINEKLPLVVEIVDQELKIEKFTEIILPYFNKIGTGSMVTIEDAKIILNKQGSKKCFKRKI